MYASHNLYALVDFCQFFLDHVCMYCVCHPTICYAACVCSTTSGSSFLSEQWEGNPLLYVTSILLVKSLSNEQFEVGESLDKHVCEFTKEEENALWYKAGYVCWKIEQRIKSSAQPFRIGLTDLSRDMRGDEESNDRTKAQFVRQRRPGTCSWQYVCAVSLYQDSGP